MSRKHVHEREHLQKIIGVLIKDTNEFMINIRFLILRYTVMYTYIIGYAREVSTVKPRFTVPRFTLSCARSLLVRLDFRL